jgi:hypothetical protein
MPSSISSSDLPGSYTACSGAPHAVLDPAADPAAVALRHDGSAERLERPGFVRLTASDRPGVAQPVPVRDIPAQPWRLIFLIALVLFALLMTGWELYWRSFGASPSYRNSDGQWAQQRRRIDTGEGNKTVLIGSSRVLFDVQLPVWEKLAGERPIQLAIEGTSSVPVLEDLAADPNFTGRLLVGVAPDLFFSGFAYRGNVLPFYHKEGLTQRSGNWLSMHLLEPFFAFDDPDFALATVVRRQAWPLRSGMTPKLDVRKLRMSDADRNTHMWDKVETDPDYRTLARSIWAGRSGGPPPPDMDTPAKLHAVIDTQIQRAADAVAKLRARGVQVVFVRPPSAGRYLAFENHLFPRAQTWDVLLKRTGAPGVHFEDYPELQGYNLPEWSHLASADARRFTAALYRIVERQYRQRPPGKGGRRGKAA